MSERPKDNIGILAQSILGIRDAILQGPSPADPNEPPEYNWPSIGTVYTNFDHTLNEEVATKNRGVFS